MSSRYNHESIDLAGKWDLHIDNSGRETDIPASSAFTAGLQLPGDLQSQGFGEEVRVETSWIGEIRDSEWYTGERYAPYRKSENVKIPYWLQPKRRFIGAAWYRRTVIIPDKWKGQWVTLHLERPHWESRIWIDGVYRGSNDSLSVPHEYDLGNSLDPGPHTLLIRVDNRMIHNIGPNSHSIGDHTQGNWNGIVGAITLFPAPAIRLRRADVYPSISRRSAIIHITVENTTGMEITARVEIASESGTANAMQAQQTFGVGVTNLSIEYRFDQATGLWDEFSPSLVQLEVRLIATIYGRAFTDSLALRTGLRSVSISGTQLSINGRPVFLRGTLECCVFPLTGYPPTDRSSWQRLYGQAKAHGLNHIRFHSWCPPEVAFDVADEMGVYLQIECSTWANQGAEVGIDPDFDQWLYREGERIVNAYGNHPSFIMMAYGNEPAGRLDEFLGAWVSYWKMRDGRRVYTSGAGWPMLEENDYHNTPIPRVQAWGQELQSRINSRPPETLTDYSQFVADKGKPVVSHEIGQWCAFPNFDEIRKYTGAFRARNFEIFRDFLSNNHLGDQAHEFLIASGKLQVECYKEDIESALRTTGFAGFQLLGLSDFPGQGSALVGVLDAFWDSKGYVSAEQFREFCSETVPLLRMRKRYWTLSETFTGEVEIAHFGAEDIEHATITWALCEEAARVPAFEANSAAPRVIATGSSTVRIPTGGLSLAEGICCDLSSFQPATRYSASVSVSGEGRATHSNRWDIWVFDDSLVLDAGSTHVSSSLDRETIRILESGESVFLEIPPPLVNTDAKVGFSSVFWNTAWTEGQAPHTLGLVCDPHHPVFNEFPTRAHSDWLWWEPLHGAQAMVLNHFPASMKPLVQPIDTWFRSHRLGLLFEARVGAGRVIVSSMDLSTALESRPVARQLRYSILRYMGGSDFNPKYELSVEDMERLIRR